MKTLLLTEIFPPTVGGSGRLFWEVYSRLPPKQYLIAAADVPGAAEFDHTHRHTVFRLPMQLGDRGLRRWASLRYYLRTAWRVKRLVKEHGIQMLHCGRNLPEGFVGYMVNKLCGVPFLFVSHGEDIGVTKSSREMTWMTRRVMRRAVGVVANSFNTRRMLLEDWGYPEEKVHVLQPGVDAAKFTPAPPDDRFRAEMGWAGRTVLLTVGRLQKRKGHDMVIRALPAVGAKVPNVLYVIVGQGEEAPNLWTLAEQHEVLDAVRFLGGLPDDMMTKCYQQCDLFVLANRTIGVGDIEGFGMVLLEAQACGKGVVAGDSGGTGETMNTDTGRVVNCDGPEKLAAVLSELLSDPAELAEMGRRGRAWVEGRFDWPQVAARAAEVFDRLVNPGSHAGGGVLDQPPPA
jgi:phosphatidylinositol alpha-1,6-mannosyltransferase